MIFLLDFPALTAMVAVVAIGPPAWAVAIMLPIIPIRVLVSPTPATVAAFVLIWIGPGESSRP
jgi:hypothetical protein